MYCRNFVDDDYVPQVIQYDSPAHTACPMNEVSLLLALIYIKNYVCTPFLAPYQALLLSLLLPLLPIVHLSIYE